MLVVAIPTIAAELHLSASLQLWPASVYALSLSCFLLPLGAITDIAGARPVCLIGLILYTAFTLAVSLAQTGEQLIGFRVVQGIAMAFCLPPAVATITTTFPPGRTRNTAFAVFGGGNPIGFAMGLVLGGVFAQASTWRAGYWMSTGINGVATILAFFVLPSREEDAFRGWTVLRRRMAREIDWVGTLSASTCLALLSYIFAEFSDGASASLRRKPYLIALLVIAVVLIPIFIAWEHFQEKHGRPAVLPNSIWRRREFTAVCLATFLTWAWVNAFSYWSTLYFQETQGLNALQTALRFLPLVIVGLLTNVVAAMTLDRIDASMVILVGGVASAIAPLLFAVQRLSWSYWEVAFPAMIVAIISSDLLFNISNLVITKSFPKQKQGLAGGVFNTVAQLGNSIGLAVTAMIANAVTEAAGNDRMDTVGDLTYNSSLLAGYRSGFWFCFGVAAISAMIAVIGLRKAGKVGTKEA